MCQRLPELFTRSVGLARPAALGIKGRAVARWSENLSQNRAVSREPSSRDDDGRPRMATPAGDTGVSGVVEVTRGRSRRPHPRLQRRPAAGSTADYVLYWMIAFRRTRLELRARPGHRARARARQAAGRVRVAPRRLPLGERPPPRLRPAGDARQRAPPAVPPGSPTSATSSRRHGDGSGSARPRSPHARPWSSPTTSPRSSSRA